jgi:hypothetical protein
LRVRTGAVGSVARIVGAQVVVVADHIGVRAGASFVVARVRGAGVAVVAGIDAVAANRLPFIVDVTGAAGAFVSANWLANAFPFNAYIIFEAF